MVFEKYAVMNNKYDAKIVGDLIAEFKIEDEMKTIKEDIHEKMIESKVKVFDTIFDPIGDRDNRKKAKYEFTEYESRYGIS